MPEVGFPELILIAIVGLLVIGPERLPETLRTLGLWFGRMRRSFNTVKAEIEKEIGMDEVKRQLHNEAIMEEMKRIETEVKNTADTARSSLNEGMEAAHQTIPSIDPNAHDEVSEMIAAQDGGPTSPQADDRDHTDAGSEPDDDRDHTDAGNIENAESTENVEHTEPTADVAVASTDKGVGGDEGAGGNDEEAVRPSQVKSG